MNNRNKLNGPWGWFSRFVRILRGDDLERLRELEVVMKHWHREQTIALAKAEEALECGNRERSAMWSERCREARLRCDKDFRRPMLELTGDPYLFDTDVLHPAPGEKGTTHE